MKPGSPTGDHPGLPQRFERGSAPSKGLTNANVVMSITAWPHAPSGGVQDDGVHGDGGPARPLAGLGGCGPAGGLQGAPKSTPFPPPRARALRPLPSGARVTRFREGAARGPEAMAGGRGRRMAWSGALGRRGWSCAGRWGWARAPPRHPAGHGGLVAPLRINLFLQQRSGFRKAPKKIEPRRPDSGSGREAYRRSALTPPVEETVFYTSPCSLKTLVKPFIFTVGFTGCAFGSAAIWQYESLKLRVQSYFDGVRADWLDSIRPQKEGDFRKQINHWWNNLSDGQRTVTGIIAANVFVFCLWRVPSLQRSMIKYFTSNPASKTLCSPMLLSTFSHFSLFHMAANMYVLWSFSSSIVNILGREQFMAVYLSAGVISTFVSYVSKVVTGRFGPSLGASGAIMTVLAAVCTKLPESKLAIIILPMFTFTAGNALKAIIAMDTAGMILGWKFFDHAAHLGGALFGIWYVTFGHELIWKKREPLVKLWHEMRTNGPKKGGGSE
uniref:Presenilin-associated rhomboid-like protein, mitochondrial n=2 Tax=Ornithorhynchus anatinus TaxID=9258 RepID=A0A6I8P5M8_ORNAN